MKCRVCKRDRVRHSPCVPCLRETIATLEADNKRLELDNEAFDSLNDKLRAERDELRQKVEDAEWWWDNTGIELSRYQVIGDCWATLRAAREDNND